MPDLVWSGLKMLKRSALGLLVLLGTYSAQAQQQGIPYYQPGPGKSNYDYERDREMCTKLVRPRNDAKYSECMAARGDLVFQRTTNGLVPSAPALSPQQAQAYQVPFQRPPAAGTCQRFARGDPQMYNKCLSSAHLDAQLTCRQTTKERGAYMQCMAANGFPRETQTLDEQHATEERQLRAMGAIMESWAKSPPPPPKPKKPSTGVHPCEPLEAFTIHDPFGNCWD
jgi:hypothetical protein